MQFMEASAKSSKNIHDAFANLGNQIKSKILSVKKITPSEVKEKTITSFGKTKSLAKKSPNCC